MKTRPKKASQQKKNESKAIDSLDKKLGGPNRPST
ncbi:acid-soluble spore protein SspM [Bacillus vallismortis]|nr:acid-soluble spore protein SspM [Bacillus vallismortis]MCO4850407.1 acid-soluble spore protein SspM [Bacillus vallismortis]